MSSGSVENWTGLLDKIGALGRELSVMKTIACSFIGGCIGYFPISSRMLGLRSIG